MGITGFERPGTGSILDFRNNLTYDEDKNGGTYEIKTDSDLEKLEFILPMIIVMAAL